MKKTFLTLALCFATTLTLMTTALAARFTDVPDNAWYGSDVEYAVQNGLVSGTSATTYSPNKNLTYAEAVKLAACMHKKVTADSTDFPAGSPWYQPYVDYAKANGIIARDYSWSANVTRADYMAIFANAIPDTGLLPGYSALTAINTVDDGAIPDVPAAHPQASGIYKLYRAGILQGSDDAHSCLPASAIRRSEVAAILTRMMDSDKRVSFTMPAAAAGDHTIITQPENLYAMDTGYWMCMTVAVADPASVASYCWQYAGPDTAELWSDIPESYWGQYFDCCDTDTLLLLDTFDWHTGHEFRCKITFTDGTFDVSQSAYLLREDMSGFTF